MKTTGRKNLALLELVLVLLFVALSGMVLAQVFARAYTLSTDARARTTGQAAVEDIIEQWKSGPTVAQALFLPAEGWRLKTETDTRAVYIALRDADCQPLTEQAADGAGYQLTAVLQQEKAAAGTLYRIRVTLISLREGQSTPLVDCETALYLADEGRDSA